MNGSVACGRMSYTTTAGWREPGTWPFRPPISPSPIILATGLARYSLGHTNSIKRSGWSSVKDAEGPTAPRLCRAQVRSGRALRSSHRAAGDDVASSDRLLHLEAGILGTRGVLVACRALKEGQVTDPQPPDDMSVASSMPSRVFTERSRRVIDSLTVIRFCPRLSRNRFGPRELLAKRGQDLP
jgi:hypothetical protein